MEYVFKLKNKRQLIVFKFIKNQEFQQISLKKDLLNLNILVNKLVKYSHNLWLKTSGPLLKKIVVKPGKL